MSTPSQVNIRFLRMNRKYLYPEDMRDVEVRGAPPPSQIRCLAKPPTYRRVSGRVLMESGELIGLAGDYDSRIFHFKAHTERTGEAANVREGNALSVHPSALTSEGCRPPRSRPGRRSRRNPRDSISA